jgi:serine/threonine protein kinase
MNVAPSLHPSDQTLSSYGLGKLDDRAAEAISEHLMLCSDCRKRVAEMSADSFLQRVRDAQKPSGKSTADQSRAGGTQSDKVANTLTSSSADSLPPGLAAHPDYEIKRELGRGGMGVVYLAHNKLMGRDEVLKVMGQHQAEHSGVLERFLREIRSVAKLRHPNIVTAYHATRFGQSVLFAMEYVEGLDLSKLVKAKGPLPIAHACLFIHQAALGLQHAHEEGLVHRDIKPHNLMLARKGDQATVKILDFGLAKAAREEKVDGGLTATGQALGTPDYIAPEQIINAPTADIRADIYSLGGTLYYLLTGRPPFQEKSLYDLYQAHISRIADPLNLIRPDVPAELAAFVAKMMAKDPAQRFRTPGEVAQALKPFCTKANAALKVVKADVSSTDPAKVTRSVAEAASAATQAETDADRQIVRTRKATEPSGTESRWESMIDFREAGNESVPSLDAEPGRRSSRKLWPVAVGASLFGLILLGVIIITIRDRSGRVTGKTVLPKGSMATVEVSREEATSTIGGASASRHKSPSPTESEGVDDLRPKTGDETSPPVVVAKEPVGDSSVSPLSVSRPDVALEILTPVKATTGWGAVYMNKNAQGLPIELGGRTYPRGVGVHANSELVYNLKPEYDRFVGRVGIDDRMKESSSIIVRIFANEKLLGESPLLNAGATPWEFNLELPKDSAGRASGRLRLVVDGTDDGIEADMTDWVDVGFVVNRGHSKGTGVVLLNNRLPSPLIHPFPLIQRPL